jgi:hypothetical protein
MKKILKSSVTLLIPALLVIFLLLPILVGARVYAACQVIPQTKTCTDGSAPVEDATTTAGSCSNPASPQDIAQSCPNSLGEDCADAGASACLQQSAFAKDLQLIVNVLSAGVGIVVTGMIILGGVQYILAGGNATAVTAARTRITNALIALLAFMFIWAFLNWLIPGGVFT